jgi:outer membrane protein TolC
MDTANFNVRYTRNQLRPAVNLFGNLTYTGTGGDRIVRGGELGGDALLVIPGGYSDALDQLFGGNFHNWRLGVEFLYPLGNSSADADNARAQIEYRRQRASLTNLELQIAQEVREAARSVETGRKRVDATRVSRELAAKRLDAELKKFAVGMSTNFFVVQAQRDLSQAEANELRAVIDYNRALVNFRRARGTLIEDVNVEVK